MKSVDEVRLALGRHFRRQLPAYLSAHVVGRERIHKVSLAPPTFAQASADWDGVARWAGSWVQADRLWPWSVEYVVRRWGHLGGQSLPARVVVSGGADLAGVVEAQPLWESALEAEEAARPFFWEERGLGGGSFEEGGAEDAYFRLVSWVSQSSSVSDVEQWCRCLSVAQWIVAHPDSGARIRSLPIEGVDTKWLERHRDAVQRTVEVLRSVLGRDGGSDLGLAAQKESSFTVVWADPSQRLNGIRQAVVGLPDLCRMTAPDAQVWVFENLDSVLAVPDLPGVVVIHGGGKRAVKLAEIPWMLDRRILYWGDLDSFGFEILASLRAFGVQAQSVLMDVDTLKAHRRLWVEEPVQSSNVNLEFLTAQERAALCALEEDGIHWRLEQERIPWGQALAVLKCSLTESDIRVY